MENNILIHDEDRLNFLSSLQNVKALHFSEISTVISDINNSPKLDKIISSDRKKILSDSYNNLYSALLKNPLDIYWMNSHIIEKHFLELKAEISEQFDESINEHMSSLALEHCLYLFNKMNRDEIILFSQSDSISYDDLVSVLNKKIIQQLNLSYKLSHDGTKQLFSNIKEAVKESEIYALAKNTRHYISSPSKLKDLMKEFLRVDNQEEYSINYALLYNVEDTISNDDEFDDHEIKEFTLVFSLFMFRFYSYPDNFYGLMWNYLYHKWIRAMEDEVASMNLNTKEHIAQIPSASRDNYKSHFVGNFDIQKKQLTSIQKSCIQDIQDALIDSTYKTSLINYITRMFKKNTAVRLFDWKTKNTILSDKEMLQIYSVFDRYQIDYVTEDDNDVIEEDIILEDVSESWHSDIINIDSAQDYQIDSIQQALEYFKAEFPSVILDEKLLLDQYDNFTELKKANFLYAVKKSLYNKSLWKKSLNQSNKKIYYKLYLWSWYRFAWEKKTWRVFLWSHEDYEKWLRVKG